MNIVFALLAAVYDVNVLCFLNRQVAVWTQANGHDSSGDERIEQVDSVVSFRRG
jgi:hypothetical protein